MTGPFVVKELAPCACADGCTHCEQDVPRVVSVKAFETLEDARDHAWEIVNNAPGSFLRMPVLTLARMLCAGESLRLPGGEITVERQTYLRLATEAGVAHLLMSSVMYEREILSAFNAFMAERYAAQEER